MKKVTFLLIVFFALPAFAHAVQSGTWALRPYMNLDGVPAPRITLDAPPEVGDQTQFWVWDLSNMPPSDKQIWATCRGVSDYGYVFVEDDQWNVAMDQDDVDAILEAWDESSPAGSVDPDAGIWDIETSLFGDAPDVDGWPGVVLLYYEIGCFMGQCFDGFYRYDDQIAGPTSNLMDMLHLEATQSPPAGEYMLGVTAHEFNHMIQMTYDTNEEMWLSEALAGAAMIVAGYDTDIGWLNDFVNDPTVTFWDEEMSVHYGAALLLGTYLYEYGGIDLLQNVTADGANGENSIEDQLAALDLADTFSEFFGDMAAAIAADYFVDGAKGPDHYEYLDIGELDWSDEIAPDFEPFTLDLTLPGGTLDAYRFDFTGADAVSITLPEFEADALEVGFFSVTGSGVKLDRYNVTSSNWPELAIDLPDTETAVLVLANPTHSEVETSAEIRFFPTTADDDTTDDDADDDAGDDDAGDDDLDDDFGDDDGDDDDDDGGCGC
ncbi:MAG: hypothetical protein ACTSXZ_00585 [Alphaproteobacteria bacterium]